MSAGCILNKCPHAYLQDAVLLGHDDRHDLVHVHRAHRRPLRRLLRPHRPRLQRRPGRDGRREGARRPGTNIIKIGLPGKPILSKRKGLHEVIFS